MVKVFYATSNKKKLMDVIQLFGSYDVELVGPRDLNIEMEMLETGKTLEANAVLKCRTYAARLRNLRAENYKGVDDKYIIIADDTGLKIDALGEEPGVMMRRWKDGHTQMNDDEIISYCLDRLQRTPPESRGAEFRCVVTVLFPTENSEQETEVEYFDGRLRGLILEQPNELRVDGYPFYSLFYVPEWEMVLGEVYTSLSEEQRGKYQTHREIAIDKALERVLEWRAG